MDWRVDLRNSGSHISALFETEGESDTDEQISQRIVDNNASEALAAMIRRGSATRGFRTAREAGSPKLTGTATRVRGGEGQVPRSFSLHSFQQVYFFLQVGTLLK